MRGHFSSSGVCTFIKPLIVGGVGVQINAFKPEEEETEKDIETKKVKRKEECKKRSTKQRNWWTDGD
jgi:hypothetical protein